MGYDFDQIIERRHTESSKWHKYGAHVLPFHVADMDFRAPEPVVEALRRRVEHGVFGYVLEQPEFSEILTDRLRTRYRWHVSPEAIVSLPGVIPGFNLACRTAAAAGDGILMQLPAYPPILRCPGNLGATRDEVPLARRGDGGYEVDSDAFERAIRPRTRAFLLCNPHNPVGRAFAREELTAMAERCLRHDLAICADEIHCDLVYPGREHIPIASLAPEVEARTITLMSPSKAFNLPGLRTAFAVIPNASLRERFVAARADLVQTANVLGYTALIAAYRDAQPWLEALLHYLAANRDLLVDYVRTRLPGVRVTPPEATYLAWLDFREAGIPGGDPFTFFLERAGVSLHDGRAFGPGGDGFARLTFGCPRPMLVDGLERMRRALESARR
jgi:cystathionine beta-lyase